MKLRAIQAPVVGAYHKQMYGVDIKEVSPELLEEMKEHARSIGGGGFLSSTVWFESESARTLFLLRWQ